MPLFVIGPINADDDAQQPDPQGAQALGHAAGVRWYKDATVPADGRAPTDEELSVALLELPAIRHLKSAARRRIEREVGDVHEILADQAKQIEALTALCARLAADYLGGTPLDTQRKTGYLARVEGIVAALDSGQLVLRGDAEGADEMIGRVMGRSSRINRIVTEEYLPRRDEVLS